MHRAGDLRRLLEQVGTADVADEHEIAGDGGDRLIGHRAVGDQEGQVFRRVSGRVQDVDRDVADRDAIAVLQLVIVIESVLPVLVALVAETKPGARPVRQLA